MTAKQYMGVIVSIGAVVYNLIVLFNKKKDKSIRWLSAFAILMLSALCYMTYFL